jgi:small subunit ribosomal protein S19
MRSNWKLPFFTKKTLKNIKNNLTIFLKQQLIIFADINKKFKVYNGKIFNYVYINSLKIGHKFGEFCFTRKMHLFNNKKKKK